MRLQFLLRGRLFPFAVCALFFLAAGVALALWLPRALAPIAAAERLFSAVAALAVAGGDEPCPCRLSKIFLVLLLPWVGAVLCLLLRARSVPFTEKEGGMSAETLSEKVAALSSGLSSLPACASGDIAYFSVGSEMASALLRDMKQAKRRIWLEFYIVAEGKFLSGLLAVMREKAREGVDVRLVYDGFGSSLTLPRKFEKQLRAEGIFVSCFRPLRLPSFRAGRRDHRKIAVVDGAAYTGGVNIADEYIGEKIRFGHWKDTAVRVTGSAAERFASLFVRTWNKLEPQDTISSAPAAGGNIPCAVFADGCENGRRAGETVFPLLAASARRALYWNTPYLAPDPPLEAALAAAALAGTDVRIMIPHIPDKKLPFAVTRASARRLEVAGVKVREYTAGFLHAKSVVLDGKYCFIGSYNLDFRSLSLQAECGLFAEDERTAKRVETDFLAAWEEGTPLPPPGRTARLFEGILRLIAPLM